MANDWVTDLAVVDGTVYACGLFTQIGGQSRAYLAALDGVTGEATAWDPAPDENVIEIAVRGQTLYASGAFTSLGGQARGSIGAVDRGSALATAWSPAVGGVRTIAIGGSTVYLGGLFSTVNGQPRSSIAAVDATSGAVLPWNPTANSALEALVIRGDRIYAGGWFSTIGGESRSRVAALDLVTGHATAWNPGANSIVHSLATAADDVLVGGQYTRIGGDYGRKGIANFADPATVDVAPASGAPRRIAFLGAVPNPSSGGTTFAFDLPRPAAVTIEVFDVAGRLVTVPVRGRAFTAGRQSFPMEAKTVAPGVYYVRVLAGTERASGKLVVLP